MPSNREEGTEPSWQNLSFFEALHLWILVILAYEASWVASENVFFGEENFPMNGPLATISGGNMGLSDQSGSSNRCLREVGDYKS